VGVGNCAAIFGFVRGRAAAQLTGSICLPVAYNHSLLQLTDSLWNYWLFRTSDINVVTECQLNFHFQLPSD